MDDDGDGFGADYLPGVRACEAPPGRVAEAGDCDDADPDLNPETRWYPDADRDGFGDEDAPVASCRPAGNGRVGGDCDDEEPTVHEGAVEQCDGLDNDCNGIVDDDPVDVFTRYRDADGDGFGGPETALRCPGEAEGWTLTSTDCDDTAADTYPGAPERFDRRDTDCDGWMDRFGDLSLDRTVQAPGLPWVTVAALEHGPGGLPTLINVSSDRTTYEGALTVWYGFRASRDRDDLSSLTIDGLPADGRSATLAPLGDTDGDGHADLAIGAPREDGTGAVYLLPGPITRDTTAADARRLDPGGVEGVGWRVEPLDPVDPGPGFLVTGASNDYRLSPATRGPGGVWVFRDPDAADAMEDAELIVDQIRDGRFTIGLAAAEVPDMDGDGARELVVASNRNHLLLYDGTLTGVVTEDEHDVRWTGAREFGTDVIGGDFDGDGYGEVAVIQPSSFALNYIYILADLDGGAANTVARTALQATTSLWEMTDVHPLGDVDGDGRDDLAIGQAKRAAPAMVWFGSSDEGTVALRDHRIEPITSGGMAVQIHAGDLDEDGHVDLVLQQALNSSTIFLFYTDL